MERHNSEWSVQRPTWRDLPRAWQDKGLTGQEEKTQVPSSTGSATTEFRGPPTPPKVRELASSLPLPPPAIAAGYSDTPRLMHSSGPLQAGNWPIATGLRGSDRRRHPTRRPPQAPPTPCRWAFWTNDLVVATNFQSNAQPQPAQYFLRIAEQETQRAP